MIFEILTSHQGHKFGHRVKIVLALCAAHHPRQFDMSHDHVRKKDPLGTPGAQIPPLGHDPGIRTKIQFDMFYIFHL